MFNQISKHLNVRQKFSWPTFSLFRNVVEHGLSSSYSSLVDFTVAEFLIHLSWVVIIFFVDLLIKPVVSIFLS